MSSAIQNMLHSVIGDGARGTKFDAQIILKTSNVSDESVAMSVKTASFPGKQHDPITIKHRGRPIPVRGNTKYTQSWDCTFYLTEDHSLKNEFELWIEALTGNHNYVSPTDVARLRETQNTINFDSFFQDIILYQYNFDETKQTAKYTLKNAFPTIVSAVQITYEGSSQVLEFTVTFSFSHFLLEVTKGNKGNFIDNMVATADQFAQDTVSEVGNYISGVTDSAIESATGELNKWLSGETSDSKGNGNTINTINKGGIPPEAAPSTLMRN